MIMIKQLYIIYIIIQPENKVEVISKNDPIYIDSNKVNNVVVMNEPLTPSQRIDMSLSNAIQSDLKMHRTISPLLPNAASECNTNNQYIKPSSKTQPSSLHNSVTSTTSSKPRTPINLSKEPKIGIEYKEFPAKL